MVCYLNIQEIINICRNWDLGVGKTFIKMFPNLNNGIKTVYLKIHYTIYFFKLDQSEEKDMPSICYIKDDTNAEKVFGVISQQ